MGFSEALKRSSFTDWCIAAFTLVLTVVAIYQVVVTNGQLDTMRKDQRPWIKVNDPTSGITIATNATVLGTLKLVNSGKTPAKTMEIEVVAQKLDKDEDPVLDYSPGHITAATGTLYPNEPTPLETALFGIINSAGQFQAISDEMA